MSNMLLRQAAQAAINNHDALAAAYGDKSLWKLEGSIYPEGTAWYDPDAPGYNQDNPDKAAALLKQAGYKGEPIRILTSVQYDYQYKIAQVIQANLTEAGFKIDLRGDRLGNHPATPAEPGSVGRLSSPVMAWCRSRPRSRSSTRAIRAGGTRRTSTPRWMPS